MDIYFAGFFVMAGYLLGACQGVNETGWKAITVALIGGAMWPLVVIYGAIHD